MKKNTIRLNESQLRNVIKESVKRVINEISSDMIGRARDKFIEKYGNNSGYYQYIREIVHQNKHDYAYM